MKIRNSTKTSALGFVLFFLAATGVGVAAHHLKSRRSRRYRRKPICDEIDEPSPTAVEVEPDRHAPIYIYFGSQTGTAEQLAGDLQNRFENAELPSEVVDLENFSVDEMKEQSWVVFVISTYGDGEPTDNAIEFWEWLMHAEPDAETVFAKKNVAIFGLGNRQYPKFNAFGRSVHRIMKKLGADLLVDLGEGDDDGDLEEDFMKWSQNLVNTINSKKAGIKFQFSSGTHDSFISRGSSHSIRSALFGKSGSSSRLDYSPDGSIASLVVGENPMWMTYWKSTRGSPLDLACATDLQSMESFIARERESIGSKYASTSLNRFYKSCFVGLAPRIIQVCDGEKYGGVLSIVKVDATTCSSLEKTFTQGEESQEFESVVYETAANFDVLPPNPPTLVTRFLRRLGVIESERPDDSVDECVFRYSQYLDLAPGANVSIVDGNSIQHRGVYSAKNVDDLRRTYGDVELASVAGSALDGEFDFDMKEYGRGSTRLHAEDLIHFIPRQGTRREECAPAPFPTPCTIREALTYYVDLNALPARPILRNLAVFSTHKQERSALRSLVSDSNANIYRKWVRDMSLNLDEFCDMHLRAARFDLAAFFQLAPPQRLRTYTVASSAVATPNEMSLVVKQEPIKEKPYLAEAARYMMANGFCPALAMHQDKMTFGGEARVFHPCTTTYLCVALPGAKTLKSLRKGALATRTLVSPSVTSQTWKGEVPLSIRFGLRPSIFRLPRGHEPLLMVAAGAGVAPMLAFIKEMISLKEHRRKSVLIFGCKHPDVDWVEKDLMKKAVKLGVLTHLFLAFSRYPGDDDVEGRKGLYVTDVVRRERNVIKDILKMGLIFVCGSIKMGQAVEEELKQMLSEDLQEENGSESSARALGEKALDAMKAEKRMTVELWG